MKTRTRSAVVEGFAAFGGYHCETSALRKALAFQGVEVSEEMIFALAGGIGFVFWNDARMPLPFVGGRNGRFPDFLLQAAARLGIELELVQTGSRTRAWKELEGELAAGRPALCYGDIHHLPYFHTTRHFGGHAFLVYGLDEERDTVLISDRGVHPRTVTFAELEAARGSDSPPFTPRNAIYRLRSTRVSLDSAAILDAIRDSCDALLRPPIRSFGLAGVQRFREYLVALARADGEKMLEHLVAAYVNLELAGTGGCAFRRMYRRFLRHAEPYGVHVPRVVHEDLGHSITAWTRLIQGLLPEGETLGRIRRLLDEKERCFEQGTVDGVHQAAECVRQVRELWPAGAAEAEKRRAEIAENAQWAGEVCEAEFEMCRTLHRFAGGRS